MRSPPCYRKWVETVAKKAFVTLGNWIENLGKSKAQLTVSYSEGQMETGDVHATEEQQQAVLGEE